MCGSCGLVSLIATHLSLTVRQVQNFKLKFSKSRWREVGCEQSIPVDSRLPCDAEVPNNQSDTGGSVISGPQSQPDFDAAMGDATHVAGQANAVVGDATSTASRVESEAYTITEMVTQDETGTGFSSTSPTLQDDSDSPPLMSDADREPSQSPENASEPLDERTTGDSGTGFSSVALFPSSTGTGVPNPNDDCSTVRSRLVEESKQVMLCSIRWGTWCPPQRQVGENKRVIPCLPRQSIQVILGSLSTRQVGRDKWVMPCYLRRGKQVKLCPPLLTGISLKTGRAKSEKRRPNANPKAGEEAVTLQAMEEQALSPVVIWPPRPIRLVATDKVHVPRVKSRKLDMYAEMKERLEWNATRHSWMALLLGCWRHGALEIIAYCLPLGLVESKGSCSKSSPTPAISESYKM